MSGGYWDIHNHILPGIDDGSSCMEETCSLLREEYKQGVRHIIFTPHHRPKMFRVSVDDREKVWMETLSELQGKFPDMQFFLGCEFFVHENMAEELRDARCRMAGTDVVLAEFSSASHFAEMKLRIEEIVHLGFRPVIAHAERCRCLHQEEQRLEELREMGTLVQLNAGSILGREGPQLKRFCIRALEKGLADMIASDAHSVDGRPVELAACMKKMQRKFGKERADRWFGGVQKTLFADLREDRRTLWNS